MSDNQLRQETEHEAGDGEGATFHGLWDEHVVAATASPESGELTTDH